MAKKRKDLSGQLDGLFADFDSEEEAEAGQAEPALPEGPQAIDELVEGEPVEFAEQAQPAAEQAEEPQLPAIDALLAAEPAIEAMEEEQAEPALAEPAIDALLAAEPVELPEQAAIEEVEAELAAELPTMAELLATEEIAEPAAEVPVEAEQIEAEIAEQVEPSPVELPTLAELLAAEEAPEPAEAPAGVEVTEPVVLEAVETEIPAPGMEEVAWEDVQPAPSEPFAWEETIREQRIKILNALLIFITAVGTLVILSLVVKSLSQPDLWGDYIFFFVAWAVLVVLTVFRRLDPLWRVAGLGVLAYLVGVTTLYLDGLLGAGWLYLLLAPLLISTLVGRRAGVYAALGSFGIYLAFSVTYMLGWWKPAVATLEPENWDWSIVLLNMSGTFGMILAAATMIQWMFNSALVTSLHEAGDKHAEVVRSREALRERAAELTAANVALRRRTLQLETASQVSQAASSELDPDELMQQVVDLIRERFDLYYVGLFLAGEVSADVTQHELALKAGTGVAGRWMLAQSYSVEIGDESVVGQCAARGQAQTKLKLDEEGEGFAGDLLPQTHSEVALPLRSRGRVLGALDVHSIEHEAFFPEDVIVLQTMADQIAVTIDNARLFAELRQRLQEMEASQRLYVREQWTDLAPRRVSPFYERARPDAKPLTDAALSEVEEVALRREMVATLGGDEGTDEVALVTPISLRGQIIGALGLQETVGRRQWTEDEIALIEAVTDQMALAIENVRLLEETRQLAGWEQTLSDITARFSRSLDTETLLQTAIQELGDLLQMDEVSVHIGSPAELASAENDEAV